MKSTIKYLMYIAVLFVVSCTQPTDMLTVINSDGSCFREFSENVDSAFLMGNTSSEHNPFPTDIDSTWQIAWSYKNSGLRTDFPLSKSVFDSIAKITASTGKIAGKTSKEHVIVFARRNYKSVEEMDSTFRLKCNHKWKDIKVKHKLDMDFRWFYTYYTYSETYPKTESQVEIPLENYLSKDEAMFWFTGEPNILQGLNGIEIREYIGKVEDNYNRWLVKNAWNAEYKTMLSNYKLLEKPPVSSFELTQLRDSIFNAKVKNSSDFKMEQILNDFFKTKAFSVLWQGENSPLKNFEEAYYEHVLGYLEESFNYKLILPGKITQMGNAVLRGDTLTWKLTAYRMYPADYTIQAQSRKANVWAFILTGIIAIIAIGSFLWKPKPR